MLIQLDPNQTGPLGIHVLPYCDNDEQCDGLIIQDIEKNSRIDRDGRIVVGDRIIEVNDQTLLNVNFEDAQQIIASALQMNDIRLKIIKNARRKAITNASVNSIEGVLQGSHSQQPSLSESNMIASNYNQSTFSNQNLTAQTAITSTSAPAQPPPPVPPKPLNTHLNGQSKLKSNRNQSTDADYVNFEQLSRDAQKAGLRLEADERQIDSLNSIQPTSLTESADFSDDSGTVHSKPVSISTSSNKSKSNSYNVCNTRKIGKKLCIKLVKGRQGLGFSITTRDNQIGQCPIYIRTILSNGAAIEDGRLKQGDRLLEVNGIEMTGKTHDEVLSVLRSISTGSEVELLVSRQDTNNESAIDGGADTDSMLAQPSPKLPRQLPIEKSEPDPAAVSTNAKQVITLSIPLNDTGSAGLGVSVKGKTSSTNVKSGASRDLGIFVKSVFHGGAAFKDGRLRPNDQLMKINGIDLLTLTNVQAMETLRRVVLTNDGPDALPNAINLTIARSRQTVDRPFDSEQDAMGENIYGRFMHTRDASTLSTDSVQLNGQALNYHEDMPSAEDEDDNVFERTFDQSNATVILASCDLHKSINESENLRKNHFNNDQLQPKYEEKGRFNDLTGQTTMQFDRTDPLCTPSKSGYRKPFGFLTPNRVDCHIEDDNDQENNDPNVFRRNMMQQLQGAAATASVSTAQPIRKFASLCALEADQQQNESDVAPEENEMANLSSVTSQMSLNDDDREMFQRDGFGRQSMSEKRHAQLDVKQTDTYKRNRQRKQQVEIQNQSDDNPIVVDKHDIPSDLPKVMTNRKPGLFAAAACCCSFASQMTKSESQSLPSSCPYHTQSSQSPQTERSVLSPQSSCSTGVESSNNFLDSDSSNLIRRTNVEATSSRGPVTKSTVAALDSFAHLGLPQNVIPIERTAPGTHIQNWQHQQQWMAQQQPPLNHKTNLESKNGFYSERNPMLSPQSAYVGPFGMKKSCSLESMQTIMHEIQREKQEHLSPSNLPASYRFKTLKVARNRTTNESFRTAVDRSYPTGDPCNQMETVSEEFGELVNQTNRPMMNYTHNNTNNFNETSAGLMCKPSTTSIGTVLSNGTTTASQFTTDFNDEEVGLIRRRSTGSSKKKSGLLRTLFRFGSKKFKDKDKQVKANANQVVKKELEEEVEKIRARKAALFEQERIQEYYRRLLDQQKLNETVQPATGQSQSPAQHNHVGNQSKVYPHQSSIKTNPNPIRSSATNGMYAQRPSFEQPSLNDASNRMRTNFHTEASLRVIENTQRWVNRQATMHYGGTQTLTPKLERRRELAPKRYETMHARAHSYDIKEAIQRPGSRMGIVDTDNNFTHFMNYKDALTAEQFERRAKEVVSTRIQNGTSPLYGLNMGSRIQHPMAINQVVNNQLPMNTGNIQLPGQMPRRSSFHQKVNSLHKKRTRPLSDYEIETYGADLRSAQQMNMPNEQIYDTRLNYRPSPDANTYGTANVPIVQPQQFPGFVNRNTFASQSMGRKAGANYSQMPSLPNPMDIYGTRYANGVGTPNGDLLPYGQPLSATSAFPPYVRNGHSYQRDLLHPELGSNV